MVPSRSQIPSLLYIGAAQATPHNARDKPQDLPVGALVLPTSAPVLWLRPPRMQVKGPVGARAGVPVAPELAPKNGPILLWASPRHGVHCSVLDPARTSR